MLKLQACEHSKEGQSRTNKEHKTEDQEQDVKKNRDTKGRPSAAALGFSTVGMTDKQVRNVMNKGNTADEKKPTKKTTRKKADPKARVKNEKKHQKVVMVTALMTSASVPWSVAWTVHRRRHHRAHRPVMMMKMVAFL